MMSHSNITYIYKNATCGMWKNETALVIIKTK